MLDANILKAKAEAIKTLRINNAVFFGGAGEASVKNVAVYSGFQDPQCFFKVFKAVIGQAPKEDIKKLHRQEGSHWGNNGSDRIYVDSINRIY